MSDASTQPNSLVRLVVLALRGGAVLLVVLSVPVGVLGVTGDGELAPAFVAVGITGVFVAFWLLVFAIFIERRTTVNSS